ncbi:hypothetical protein BH160DRAFT_0830 [Burkholderia sp. H160]|nr:hypothetical protein BH160DRAFT_0830 [Burkholderia sp. H160]
MFRQAEDDLGALIHAPLKHAARGGARQPAGHALMIATLAVCWWSLVETPLDFVTRTGNAFAAAVAAKLIVVTVGLAVVMSVRFAREIFAFLSGVSILALGSTIPLAFDDSMWIALISLIDCGSKFVFLVFACGSHSEKGRRVTTL